MKVAIIAGAIIPGRTANSIQTMKMAQAFVRAGYATRLWVPGKPPTIAWEEIASHYGLTERIEIEWLPAARMGRRYDFAWCVVHGARRWGAELIFTRLPQAAAIASQLNIPTIYEAHDLPQGRVGPLLFRAFLRGRGARRLVCISRALARDLAARFGAPLDAPFTVIAPDGVDLERYANLPSATEGRRTLGLPERFTAGYSGHLYAGRGVELIIEMARRLPEINFLVVGGEPEDVARLRGQAAELAKVKLTGFVPNSELPRYQAACDALLMPYQARVSASSGGDIAPYLSPMKMFEYLACGRAILASDLPVLQEVLNEESAIILPAADAGAWAGALRRLQSEPEHGARLGREARRTAEKHSWERRVEGIMKGIQ